MKNAVVNSNTVVVYSNLTVVPKVYLNVKGGNLVPNSICTPTSVQLVL